MTTNQHHRVIKSERWTATSACGSVHANLKEERSILAYNLETRKAVGDEFAIKVPERIAGIACCYYPRGSVIWQLFADVVDMVRFAVPKPTFEIRADSLTHLRRGQNYRAAPRSMRNPLGSSKIVPADRF